MAYGGYEANGGTAARRHRAIKILLAGGFRSEERRVGKECA